MSCGSGGVSVEKLLLFVTDEEVKQAVETELIEL
jgi:hypothetical protein